ncbi:S8 family serine peptidase [Bacillus sp. JJ722]|uniref:S8 family serine peptidase n=1 Tax=Bacillus sp. JJ722 TaxID=3122973 RepID=UPI002FFF9CDA
MKKLAMLLSLILAIGPITGYAAPDQASENGLQGQSDTLENTETSNQPNVEVNPPVSKKQVKEIFSEADEYAPRELVISFNASASEARKQEILNQYDLKIQSTLLNGDYILVSTPRGDAIQDIAKELVQYKEIAYVQPNTKVKKEFVSQEPYYYKQWHLPKIEAPKAWDVTKGSSNVVVAVIDGGAQKDHPDLKHSIVSPIDMVTGSSNYIPDDHGTHVAGIIASAFNKYGTAGIAPNTKIMPINVFEGEYAETFTIASAIEYAVKNGADIINLSLGDYAYDYVEDSAIQYAVKNGVTVIAAAGNEDTDFDMYPAGYRNVIAVGATDRNDDITYFSNYGKNIDVTAPGEAIMSTITGSRYGAYDGTSQAAPVVSGIAALILAKNPFTTVGEVQSILKKSSVDYGNRGWDMFYGNGRVSAYKALSLTSLPITNFQSPSSFTITGKNRMSVSFTAPKNTRLTVQIQNANGKVVKTLLSNKAWNGGKATVYWNGSLDNATYASNGKYKFVVSLSSNKGNFRTHKTINVKNTMPATVSAPAVTYFSPVAQSKVSLPVNISKPAKVTAQVVNGQGKLVKSIWNNVSLSAGSRTLSWDGKNENRKYIGDGTYKVQFTAVDGNKVKSTTSASIILDSKAPALSVAADPAVFIANGTNTSTARFNVKEPLYVTVKVVSEQGVTVRTLANNQSFSASTHSLKWNGKNNSNVDVSAGKYQYVVEGKDRAGNKTTKASSFFTLQR